MNTTRVYFQQRPQGMPGPECFDVRTEPVEALEDGDVRVAVRYLSLDPYMRGRMSDRKSYIPGFVVGEVLQAGAVGEVIASRNPRYPTGSFVLGAMGWESVARVVGGRGLTMVNPDLAPLSYYLGVLGMPGMTAYVGLLDLGQPKQGETVYVSSAAGAVGQVVGQLAKIRGCRVVGSVGSDDKVRYLVDDLGFDAAWNRRAISARDALADRCPDGVDVYFDNVGGPTLDAALGHMNDFGRVVICGMISQYNLPKPDPLYNMVTALVRRLTVRGFIVSDHQQRQPDFLRDVSGWIKAGRIRYREDITDGIENAPAAFARMLSGDKVGKQLIRIG